MNVIMSNFLLSIFHVNSHRKPDDNNDCHDKCDRDDGGDGGGGGDVGDGGGGIQSELLSSVVVVDPSSHEVLQSLEDGGIEPGL